MVDIDPELLTKELAGLHGYVDGLSEFDFVGTYAQRVARKLQILDWLGQTIVELSAGRPERAVEFSRQVLLRVDDQPVPEDWMTPSARQVLVKDRIGNITQQLWVLSR
jgi:hypothetical protein